MATHPVEALAASPGGLSPYLQLQYRCASAQECRLWRAALRSASRRYWKEALERAHFALDDEIYQTHAYVKEWRKGTTSARLLALSDGAVYAIDRDAATLRGVKWRLPLGTISAIELSAPTDKRLASERCCAVLTFQTGTGKRARQPTSAARGSVAEGADHAPVLVCSARELHEITTCLRRLHTAATGSKPPGLRIVEQWA